MSNFVEDTLKNLFVRNREMPDEQAVIIYFNYGKEFSDTFYEMVGGLDKLVETSGLGEYDGHEIAMDLTDGSLYFYGANAERLFKAIKQYLLRYDFMEGADVYLRFGPLEARASDIEFKLERD